jgi:outer membrane receptor protein involved in Fe transport
MARTSGADFTKFFTPSPRNESGSEIVTVVSGFTNWKIARPGIYYEDFTNQVLTFKGDLTSQVTDNHQLRGGLQVRLHDLDMTRRAGYIGGYFTTYQNYVNEVWNVSPKEYSLYAQDRMEYAGLIINLGVRLDALDIAAGDYQNFFAPFKDESDGVGPVRVPVRKEDADMYFFFSPRIGVSHPISDEAAMYFSFSQQQQPQPWSRLYTNYSDFGNPSLPVTVRAEQDPIKSTNYDLGLQWSFAEDYGLDVNAYYKDIQNYSTMGLQITPRAPWRLYILSTNWGYADSRGLELTLRKNVSPVNDWLGIGGRLTYAYSYVKASAYTGGNATTFATAAGDSAKYGGQLPFDDLKFYNTIERNVLGGASTLTGGYDRPHRITYNLFLRFPEEITLSSIGTFQSGFFYAQQFVDPNDQRKRELGEGPWNKRIDLRLEKGFTFEGIGRLAVYVDVVNVFDWENIVAFYNALGTGQQVWELKGDPTGGPTINRPVTQDGTMIYDVPREIYFGLNLQL